MAKWAAERAELSPYQRAQNRDVDTRIFVHVSCVPDIDLKILQSQPSQGDVKHWAENGCANKHWFILIDIIQIIFKCDYGRLPYCSGKTRR